MEAERLSAPFKLVLRLIRSQRRGSPSTSESFAVRPEEPSPSLLKQFLSWDGVSFVFFTVLAFGFLQLPHQFDKARWCFIAAAMALIIKVVNSVNVKLYPKLLIAILGAVAAGFVVNRIDDWVTRLEIDAFVHETPEVRIVIGPKPVAPPPLSPPRSYLVFDGSVRFAERKDDKGQLVPDQNLQVGDPLLFNYYWKATGPNPVETVSEARWLYLEPDFERGTQTKMIADFKRRVSKERREHPIKALPFTLHPKDAPVWNSVYARTEDKKYRLISQTDLDGLRAGTIVAFVMVEISYM